MENDDQKEEAPVTKFTVIWMAIVVFFFIGMVLAVMDNSSLGFSAKDRPSPDGSGWYKDTGLTNAQMIEIAEFCRDNPDSFKCK